MENNELFELRNKLSALPVLEQRMKALSDKIYAAEDDVRSLLHKYETEALDVDQIQKDSLSNTILKLIGKYEGKVNKETQEMLSAKMEYDRAVERVKQLNLECSDLGLKISDLNKQKQIVEDEFRKREEIIKSKVTSEAYKTYADIQSDQDNLSKQLIEIDEAINCANKVLGTASIAMDNLKSAENWASYDIWTNGGILSHMAKYDHLDDAQMYFNRLSSQIKDLQKELTDVNINETYNSIGIDSTTRVIDFWFDNIFTDFSVRDKIRDDIEQLRKLSGKINKVVEKLKSDKLEVKTSLEENENRKNDVILSL